LRLIIQGRAKVNNDYWASGDLCEIPLHASAIAIDKKYAPAGMKKPGGCGETEKGEA
jgi:hypothetical protein